VNKVNLNDRRLNKFDHFMQALLHKIYDEQPNYSLFLIRETGD